VIECVCVSAKEQMALLQSKISAESAWSAADQMVTNASLPLSLVISTVPCFNLRQNLLFGSLMIRHAATDFWERPGT
jgi:hypothetical protein